MSMMKKNLSVTVKILILELHVLKVCALVLLAILTLSCNDLRHKPVLMSSARIRSDRIAVEKIYRNSVNSADEGSGRTVADLSYIEIFETTGKVPFVQDVEEDISTISKNWEMLRNYSNKLTEAGAYRGTLWPGCGDLQGGLGLGNPLLAGGYYYPKSISVHFLRTFKDSTSWRVDTTYPSESYTEKSESFIVSVIHDEDNKVVISDVEYMSPRFYDSEKSTYEVNDIRSYLDKVLNQQEACIEAHKNGVR